MRYNAKELVNRIQSIASMGKRIRVTRQDALKFLTSGAEWWPERTLIYLDPPYYAKGRDLYYDFYKDKDHASVAGFVTKEISRQRWIVPHIRELYRKCRHVGYDIGYSARSASQGSEVMFFCVGLKVPRLIGPVKVTESHPRLFRRLA
jgi:DNA adenine methylase